MVITHRNMHRILHQESWYIGVDMGREYSTREAAEKLGIAWITLKKHVAKGTFRVPPMANVHGVPVRLWNDADLARVKKALAGIKPGRKKRSPRKE